MSHLRIRRLKKGEVYFNQQEFFDEIGFIVRGVIYNYYTDRCWERLGRKMAETLFARKEDREWQFLTADAKTRYEFFKKENERFLARIPQYLIASCIGISPVTLSRIRQNSENE